MKPTTQLRLKPQADRRLKRGHHWIYSNEVDVQQSPLTQFQAGELAEVLNNKGQYLGVAFVNPNALICGRLIARHKNASINSAFLVRRFEQALALRERCFASPYYRLVYGDSDFLPGVVIDRYGDHCVMQLAMAGMDKLQDELLSALQKVTKVKSVIIRNDHGARDLEGLDDNVVLVGEVPEQVTVLENQTQFIIDPRRGQKTGWFYDHRLNRAQLQQWVSGARVLDVFSYLGGWGIQAAQAGAEQVICVDASQSAVEGVSTNAELNGLSNKVSAVQGKAVDVLKTMLEEGERFDCVVLDPPAFIKKRKDQRAGESAYRHLNELAVRLLGKGGLLVSASCSMPLQRDTLTDIVRGASRTHTKEAQLIFEGSQAPDHPVHPAIPETQYLKAQFFNIRQS